MKMRLCGSASGLALLLAGICSTATAQRQMENLGRGVVAVRTNSTTVYVGWRMLGTDPTNIGFNLYRATGGVTNKLNGSQLLTNTTDCVDTTATLSLTNSYFVRPVIDGVEQAASTSYILPASAPIQQYISVVLQPPAGNIQPASSGTSMHTNSYTANDCSVGDLDGDGEYEIVLKWDPSDSKDNSQEGHTGPVYLDAYKLNGTRLWRINLGKNIRAGAHYTQFMVYDLDGDGKAEVACKTAPGTVDGQNSNVIMPGDNPSAVYTNSQGYILSGPEYLTIFNGQTGAALATTNFYPDRVDVTQWGDNYGNRVDRFLGGIAYLDGQRPSLIMARGYYGPQTGYSSRNEITAWNWRNGQLTRLWWFKAGLNINNNTNSNYIGQGNHQLSIGDVDGDGKDEIVYGDCAINHDGTGLYTTGWGHGDAMHLSDMDPDRPGLEVWDVHETANPTCGGGEFRDARTGALIWGVPGTGDTGRGCAGNITAVKGCQMWSAASTMLYDCAGQSIGRAPGSDNFLVWWDADVSRELLDTNMIVKYGPVSDTTLLQVAQCIGNNYTKQTPCLSADIFGDWREEVIWRLAATNNEIRIYTTTIPATNRFYTLMHDPQYRESIAWQNVAYNQPPHTGFYFGYGMASPPVPNIVLVGSSNAPPSAPSGLTADGVSTNQIDLAWTDTATNETTFVIERSTNNVLFTQIGTVGAGVTQYNDTGLLTSITYYYRVRAGNTGGSSGYSNVASAQVLSLFGQWQVRYFGSTNNPAAAANADPDGDGMSNTNEFLAGTNPTNSLSALRIISVVPVNHDMAITWTVAGGHTSIVQATAGGASGVNSANFTDILDSLTIMSGSGEATASYVEVGAATNFPARYYRVRVVP